MTRMSEKQKAVRRVVKALWSDRSPNPDDIRIGELCPSCCGYGYYYREENLNRKIKCKTCGGSGDPPREGG